jgi:hypothetical protein
MIDVQAEHSRVDLSDANVVFVFAEPFSGVGKAPDIVKSGVLSDLMRPPVNVAQAISVSQSGGGPVQSLVLESMRSQKSVSISPQRLEVHHVSDRQDLENSKVSNLALGLATELNIGAVSAVGFNYEITFNLPDGERAGATIADKLLKLEPDILPLGARSLGGGARIFFEQNNQYFTIVIEPQGGDLQTQTVWIAANCNRNVDNLPDVQALTDDFVECFETVRSVVSRALSQKEIGE